jgi:hypothetical protein
MGRTHTRVEEREIITKILVGKPEGQDYFENLDADGRIILNWILK